MKSSTLKIFAKIRFRPSHAHIRYTHMNMIPILFTLLQYNTCTSTIFALKGNKNWSELIFYLCRGVHCAQSSESKRSLTCIVECTVENVNGKGCMCAWVVPQRGPRRCACGPPTRLSIFNESLKNYNFKKIAHYPEMDPLLTYYVKYLVASFMA